MNWLAWRQHRNQFIIFGIILIAFTAIMIPTGIHFWHSYNQTLISCRQNPNTPSCGNLANSLFETNIDQILFKFTPLGILLLPLIFGMFWGAPLLSKEYAEGTDKLAWTQSVSRRKWLSVKLIWILLATAIFMAAFATLNTWWSKTPNTLNMDRFQFIYFATQGLMPVAYALFAVSFGIMFGAWFRRTMLAVGLVLGLFVVLTLIVVPNFVRPHYMSPITVIAPMGPGDVESKIPNGAWVLTRNIVDKNGKVIGDIFPAAPPQCQQLIQQLNTNGDGAIRIKTAPSGGDPIDDCLNKAGFHQVATYQPSYRYWGFQYIEGGIYAGLSLLAVATTYWLVLRRDA